MSGPLVGVTLALALMNSCTLFAYWGFNTWVPAYLSYADRSRRYRAVE